MRKILLFVSVVTMVWLGACKKEEVDPSTNTTTNPINKSALSVTIGGNTYPLSNINATTMGNTLTIGGSDGKHDMQLLFDPTLQVGKYNSSIAISCGVDGKAEFNSATNVTAYEFEILINESAKNHIKGKLTVSYLDMNTGNDKQAKGEFDVYYTKL